MTTTTIEQFTPDVIERFWRYVNKTESCWLWIGPGGPGRPRFNYNNSKAITAARAARVAIGLGVRAGVIYRSTCDVERCVNPDHQVEVVMDLPAFGPLGEWHGRAACSGEAIEGEALWDGLLDQEKSSAPEALRRTVKAFSFCGRCPVVRDCEKQWKEDGKPAGVWGGRLVGAKGMVLADMREGFYETCPAGLHPVPTGKVCMACLGMRRDERASNGLCMNGLHPKDGPGMCVECRRERKRRQRQREREALKSAA